MCIRDRNQGDPSRIVSLLDKINPNALLIGFGRRFATYKLSLIHIFLLERMSYAKLEALANDKVILRRMDDVYSKFRTDMDVKPDSKRPSVAYFSMEYGLSHVLKIYSGGLGVLAGDYLKAVSYTHLDVYKRQVCSVVRRLPSKSTFWVTTACP